MINFLAILGAIFLIILGIKFFPFLSPILSIALGILLIILIVVGFVKIVLPVIIILIAIELIVKGIQYLTNKRWGVNPPHFHQFQNLFAFLFY